MSEIALLIVVLSAAASFGGLHWLSPGAPPRRLLWLGAVLAALLFGAWWARAPRAAASAAANAGVMLEPPPEGYATSATCRSCHPQQYESWHDSYHRSMTESAQPETVRAPWDSLQLQAEGQPYRLFRRDDEFWVELPDPDRLAQHDREGDSTSLRDAVPRVERRVLMTTGSHHYQGYWVSGARGNELWQLPFVYHLESQRFLPRRSVFLEPPDDPPYWARWNSNCIQCHSVAGQPQHDQDSDRFATRAAELGIACEACHGPGAAHAARQQNPLTRYQTRRANLGDPSIVNPARLDARRSSEVCGQCHSYFVPTDAERWW
ncbi:MAG TPA: multiheme c-type cytochrome, partial [Polyangiaceae bacterium]|nr:multiheme c-type cytochrome [Polyangiaceae bacterium]